VLIRLSVLRVLGSVRFLRVYIDACNIVQHATVLIILYIVDICGFFRTFLAHL